MQSRLHSYAQAALQFDDARMLEAARRVIPLQTLQQRAAENPNAVGGRDELVKQLLHWFKHEFFQWVHQPPCHACNSGTSGIGSAQPTPEEAKYYAGIVEVYRCNSCQAITRFPRYNHPAKLLETRRGRCGEWAQAFTLCCRALGFDIRFVNDWTDHVWTEVHRHTTPHHTTPHHITSHHITSHHITSHHITSHHITSHHITSHHT
eukprot:TRINITY_DN3496_c0_g1_i2.p2 TRINITY_DN3496_c0_g1~~TRINITY_DN3496_c0_g1_i2.p2  ORF type:complete len:206 (+),score=17.82 TRINITY_DN3496_c0_g1_i2:97-714(+)